MLPGPHVVVLSGCPVSAIVGEARASPGPFGGRNPARTSFTPPPAEPRVWQPTPTSGERKDEKKLGVRSFSKPSATVSQAPVICRTRL